MGFYFYCTSVSFLHFQQQAPNYQSKYNAPVQYAQQPRHPQYDTRVRFQYQMALSICLLLLTTVTLLLQIFTSSHILFIVDVVVVVVLHESDIIWLEGLLRDSGSFGLKYIVVVCLVG